MAVTDREADRVERDLDLLLGRAFGPHRMLGGLDVTCWCERSIVRVSHADVLAGETKSCGAGCGPLEMEARCG